MKQVLIDALKANAEGNIKKHIANIHVYLEKGVGVAEHPDVIESIQEQLNKVAEYHDQLDIIETYLENE